MEILSLFATESDAVKWFEEVPGTGNRGEPTTRTRIPGACTPSNLRRPLPLAARMLAAGLLVLAVASLPAGPAHSQTPTTPVCSNTPSTGERIECTQDTTSTSGIDIDAVDVDIDTSVDNEPGVHAKHEGAGNIDVEVKSDTTSTIDTAGTQAHGIHAEHTGTGDIIINTQKTGITTTGDSSHGVYARHTGDGNIDIDIIDGSNIDIQGGGNEYALRAELDGDGNIVVLMDDTITNNTIRIVHRGVGTSTIRVTNSTITSDQYNGIINEHSHTNLTPTKDGRTDSNTYVSDTDITLSGDTTNTDSFAAVYGKVSSNSTEGDVLIDVEDAEIVTTGLTTFGVRGRNLADVGDVRVNVRNSTVESTFSGIRAERDAGGRGAIHVDVRESSVTVTGSNGHGIHSLNDAENTTAADVQETYVENSTVTTKGIAGHGIVSSRKSVGDIVIETRNADIVTESTELGGSFNDTYALGIFVKHDISALADIPLEEGGDIKVDLQGGSIETRGAYSYGIRGDIRAGNGGEISVTTGDGNTITTTGESGHGIVTYHYGTAQPTSNITIVVGGSIDVSGAGAQGVRVGRVNSQGEPERVGAIGTDGYRRQTVTVNGSVTSAAEGVFLAGGGKVVIGPGGSITSDSGIAILATGDTPGANPGDPIIMPKLRVDMNLGGRQVAQAIGDDWIINDGGETTIAVNGTVLHEGATGVTGAVARNGAWNVRMQEEGVTVTDRTDPDPANWSTETAMTAADRDFSAADFNEMRRPTPPPPPEPEPESEPEPEPSVQMVEEPVFGGDNDVAGVIVEGDGEVYIGPEGSIRAASGIAILATGDEPELLVNSNLGGRLARDVRSAKAVSGLAILATGSAPKLFVDMDLNGRRVMDVIGDDWIINDGGETTIVVNDVTLHDGTDGVVPDAVAPNGAWNVWIREEGVTVTDRTAQDPANWTVTAPATGVIADRDFSTEDFIEETVGPTGPPVFMEEYAPRAAVYEALPDFLLRLTGPGPNRKCRTAPEERVWVRFAGGQGSYEADRSTTGATYDLDRFETEGGVSAALNERVRGWASVRHVWGSANAMSPTGGGTIDVRGLGSSVGGAWRSETGAYAVGCFSYMTYGVDFATRQAGLLRAGVDSRAYTLDVEAGLPFALTEQVQLTPRAWVVGSQVSVDSFTDAVDARVSFADANRISGGLGFVADTTRLWGEGELVLRGSVDVERLLSGTETRVQVSGEQLSAVATDSSLLVGLNGVYRQGRFSIGAEVAARQELGSDDTEYASFLNLGLSF